MLPNKNYRYRHIQVGLIMEMKYFSHSFGSKVKMKQEPSSGSGCDVAQFGSQNCSLIWTWTL